MSAAALVLAGSRGPGCPVAALGGVSHKALVPVLGIPMVERVIAALAGVPAIGRVTLMIEDPALVRDLPGLGRHFASGCLEVLPARPSPAQSALAGFAHLGGARQVPVLLTTADNCLLTPEMVTYFMTGSSGAVDVAAAVARTDMVRAAYPGVKRTSIRFRDGGRGGCNLFALRTPAATQVIDFWRQVEQNRKDPLAMLRQIGAGTALRYLANRLTLEQGLQSLGQRTGARLAAIEMPFAEAAIDVDTVDDLRLAERILAARAAS